MQRLVLLVLACALAACSAFVALPASAATPACPPLSAATDDLSRADAGGLINKVSVAVTNSPLNKFKQFIAKSGTGTYDEADVVAQINSYIKSNKVMVFSWTSCPFCKKAKAQLAEVMEPSQYKVVELDQMDLGKAFRYELSKITGRTSVPQVWVGQQFIGGCNDGPGVLTLQSQGKLVPMLKAAGCKVKA